MSMIEVMISVAILTLCCGMLTSTLTSTQINRQTSRERGIAAEGARGVLEDMHNCSFQAIFASYNADPSDDPGGPGTAPGRYFAVQGLRVADTDPDGYVGEIILPSTGIPLREDVQDASLGMPRDLNGDMEIDGLDHSADHIILPVRVVVHWRGRGGERSLELQSMLADMQKLR